MKLSIENGTVVCTLDNKNGEFLSACAGVWDGFLNGKLKLYTDKPEEWRVPAAAQESNAERLDFVLRMARRYGIETDEAIIGYNECLHSIAKWIRERRRMQAEEQKQRECWEKLCRNGCGKCRSLAYDIDLPICIKTGAILNEKNVQKVEGGVLRLFNLEPFPSENCPFNINKKQGEYNVQESTKKTGEAENRYIGPVGCR